MQLAALPGAYLGFENDDAQFVLAARSLAFFHSYRFFTFPGAPRIRIFTPGWPLLLASVAALFPDRPGAFTMFAFFFLLLSDVLAWLWLTRRAGERAGAVLFLLFALHPITVSRAGRVMTEAPYLALTLGFLLWHERPARVRAWLDGLIAAVGWLIRPAAVALMPAVAARPLRRRDWSGLAAALLPMAGVWLAWRWWSGGYTKEASEFFTARAGSGLSPLVDNIRYYSAQIGEGFWPAGLPGAVFAGSLAVVLAAFGLMAEFKENPESAAGWIIVGWLGLHLFWPWHYARYLLPVLPVALYLGARGALILAELAPPLRVSPTLALAGMLLVGEGARSWAWVATPPVPKEPELTATYAWIRAKAPTEAVFASLLWGRDTLYAQRDFSSLPSEPDAASLAAELRRRGVGYILWYPAPDLGFSTGAGGSASAALSRIGEEIAPWTVVHREAAEHAEVVAVPAG